MLSSFIPNDERIVTIEDAAELQLKQDHVVRLESRPPNIEGKGAVTIRDLVKNCLRMRPDRIIVGEVRDASALDMLQAMNTGHDGSICTLHANGPRDTLARMETMVLMAGMDLPMRAIREQVASAVDLIVHQARFKDGSRRITHVTEVERHGGRRDHPPGHLRLRPLRGLRPPGQGARRPDPDRAAAEVPGEDDPRQRHRRPADLLPRCPMTLHVTSMAIADLPGWTMYAGLVAVGIGLLGVLILAIPKPREMSAEEAVQLYASGRTGTGTAMPTPQSDQLAGAKSAAAELLKRN